MNSRFKMLVFVSALLTFGCSSDDKKQNTGDSGAADQGSSGVDKGLQADLTPLSDGAGNCMENTKADLIEWVKAVFNQIPGTTGKVEILVPAPSAVVGWAEDTSKGKPGVEAGYTFQEIEALIDGDHSLYDKKGCNGFALEHYIKEFSSGCEVQMMLYLWDMKDATAAKEMYEDRKANAETEGGYVFEEIPGIDDKVAAAWDAGFLVYAYKTHYILKITTKN